MPLNKEQFRREKGSSRGYVNIETGERISRRQYDKISPKNTDINQTRVRNSRKGTKKYNSLVRDRTAYLKEHGEKVNFNTVRKSQQMSSIIDRLKVHRGEDAKNPEVNRRRFNALKETGRIKDHVELYILSL